MNQDFRSTKALAAPLGIAYTCRNIQAILLLMVWAVLLVGPIRAFAAPGIAVDSASQKPLTFVGSASPPATVAAAFCPAGQALIGLDYWQKVVFDYTIYDGIGLRGVCGTIGPDGSITAAGNTPSAGIANLSTAPSLSQRCPANRVLNGWRPFNADTYGNTIGAIELYCSALSVTAPNTVAVGLPSPSGIIVGNTGGGNISQAVCPDKTVATGFNAASSQFSLNRIQLVCAPLTAQALTVTLDVVPKPGDYAAFELTLQDGAGSTALKGAGASNQPSILLQAGAYQTAPTIPASHLVTANTCPATLTMSANTNQNCAISLRPKQPVLALNVAAASPPLVVGIDSTYTLTVTNNGSAAATGAQVKAQFPAGLVFGSGSGTGWTCSADTSNLATCNFTGSIAIGGTSAVVLTVKPTPTVAGAVVTPSASIGQNGGVAPVPGSCANPAECTIGSSGGTGGVGSGVVLGIATSAPAPALVVGADSTYTVTVTNNGSGPATSAQAKVQFPVGLTFGSGTGTGWTCAADPANLVTCNFVGSIPPGGTSVVRLTAKPTAALAGVTVTTPTSIGQGGSTAPTPGSCANPAECTTGPSGGTGGSTGSVGSGVVLAIATSAPAPALVVGADSTYTVTVTNNGSGPATSAQAKVQFPVGLTFGSGTGTGWTCAADPSNLVTCNFAGSIPPGGTSAVRLTAKPTAALAGVTVTTPTSVGQGGSTAPTPGSCANPAECTTGPSGGAGGVGSGIALAIATSAPAPALVVGADSTYTVTVTNNGSGPATSAQAKVQFPVGLTFGSGTGTGWTCAADPANLVTCNFTGSIPAGDTSVVRLTAKPTAALAGVTVTTPTSVGQGGSTAPTPGSCANPAECTTGPSGGTGGVGAGVVLAIATSAPAPALVVGVDSTYTVTVTNNGSGPATSAQAKVQFPIGLTFGSGTGTGWTCAADPSNLVTCNFSGSIAPGGTSVVLLTAKPTAALAGVTVTTPTSVGQGGGTAPTPGSCANPAECTTGPSGGTGGVGSGVALGIATSAPAPALVVGADSTYTVTVTNNGSAPATTAQVKVQFPIGLTFGSGTGTGWICAADPANLLICDFNGSIQPGATSVVLLIAKPTAALIGVTVTTPTSVGQGGGTAPTPGSCANPAECTTGPSGGTGGGTDGVGSGVVLAIATSAPAPALVVGADSTYTVTVTNNGSAAATTAQAKVQFPVGLTFGAGTGTGWICTADPANLVTCDFNGSIPPGGTSVVLLTAKPTAALAGVTVTTPTSVGQGGSTAPTPGNCANPAECTTGPSGGTGEGTGGVGSGVVLAVSTSAPAPALVLGADSTYTVTVTNNGSAAATSAQAKVQFPVGLTFGAGTGTGWSCAADPANLVTCNFNGSIPPGGTSVVLLTAKPTSALIGVTVTTPTSIGQGGSTAPTPGSCANPAECTTGPSGGTAGGTGGVGSGVVLAIATSAPSPPLVLGAESTYTVTVTNSGSATATTAQAKVQFPVGLTFGSGTGTGWTCTADPSNLITCNFTGSIPPGGTSVVNLTAKPTAALAGVTVTTPTSIGQGGGAAPAPGSCANPAECTTGPSGGTGGVGSGVVLAVTTSAPSPALVLGADSTYTVTVTNNGSAPATTAQAKVQFPVGLTFGSGTGTGWTCTGDPSNLITCNFTGSIPPGGSSAVSLTAKPTDALAGVTVTTPTSIGQDGGTAPTPGNCANPDECTTSAGETAAVANGVLLSLATSAAVPALAVGVDSTYTLTIINKGSVPATSAQTKAQLPTSLAWMGGAGDGSTWDCSAGADNLVTCNLSTGTIAENDGQAAVAITVKPSLALIGASVSAASSVGRDGGTAAVPDTACVDPDTCSRAPAIVVDAPSGLLIEKLASKKQASVGDIVLYTVRVSYLGAGSVDEVRIDDRLPAGFRYIPGTTQMRRGSGPAVAMADPAGAPGPRLSIPVGTVGSDASVELSYRTRIGIGAERSAGVNSAQALAASGMASTVVRATVNVSGGIFSTDACILGKVYTDCNGDRRQNLGEIGIPLAKVYLEDGINITTDVNGNFSICGMRPITHVMRVDPASLPKGAKMLIGSNRNAGDAGSLFVDLKNGELHRADFPVQACSAEQRDTIRARGEALEKAEQQQKGPAAFGMQFNSDRNMRGGMPGR